MKKMLSLALVSAIMLSLAACGQKAPQKQINGNLADIMAKVYENSGLAVADEISLIEGELTDDNVESYLGTKDVEFTESLISEPMISASPHLVVLLRVKDGADVDGAVADIKEHANPQRWICVGVDPSDVRVESAGNLVLLVMAEDSEKYAEAFQGLAK